MAIAAYWLWLDRQVAATFETRRWDLPARVFARPVEIYAGAPITRPQLVAMLTAMDYRRVGQARNRGQFAASADRVEIHTRGFDFWDEPAPERRISLSFAEGGVQAVVNLDTAASLDLVRLEPVEIGRINPVQFEDRKLLRFDELPQGFVDALIAVEDRRFYEHLGVDLFGLARAMWVNLRAGRLLQGGSTLTQQLVKNFYLSRERTIRRKLVEMMMAMSLEYRHGKEQILEAYVNEVFLGQDGNRAIHGFGLAAQFHFGRPLGELSEGEWATLIGMVKGPTVYDPRRHPERSLERRNVVLGLLETSAIIDAQKAEKLRAQPIRVRDRAERDKRSFPAFIDLVKRQLEQEYSAQDLQTAGLKIFTTLDLDLQRRVAANTSSTLKAIEHERNIANLQAAIVIIEPGSGDVLALVGDREGSSRGFNRALDASRPIGSVVKPFVYAVALEQPQAYSLASQVDDSAVQWRDGQGRVWEPQNFDGRERGGLSLLEALTRSLNLATVNLAFEIGIGEVRTRLEEFGVGDSIPAYPSIVLGAIESTPIRLAESYSIFANRGFRVPSRAIIEVTDRDDRKLNRYGLKMTRVLDADTVQLVNHALARVVRQGTGRRLQREFGQPFTLAGKTGTTDDNRDSWFAGFGRNRLAVAWVGRDDNTDTGLTGSSGALRLWSAAMREANLKAITRGYAENISTKMVDLRSGTVVPDHCSNAEAIPVHRLSRIAVSTTCSGRREVNGAEGDEPAGLFDRLRGWLQ